MQEKEYLDYLLLPQKLYSTIERNITELFFQLNIRNYPVDPMEIAIKLGFELHPFSNMPEKAKAELTSGDVDGISFYDPNKSTYVIYYQPYKTKERLRFTIAHEIGHIQMGHKGESELAKRIADYYAAYMLAPSPWIGHSNCEDYIEIAKKFCLSKQCALRCLQRYSNWKRFPIKSYESTLLDLLTLPLTNTA